MSHYLRLWLFNSVLAFLLSLFFLRTPGLAPQSVGGWIFTILYLWSHLALLIFLLTVPLALIPLRFLLLGAFAFLQILLFIDTFVFQQYRFHINLFVLELLFKGGGQIIQFPWFLWAAVFVAIGFVLAVQFLVNQWTLKQPKLIPVKKGLIIWFLALFLSQFHHLLAHASHDSEITRIGRLPPFAAPLIDPVLAKKFGIDEQSFSHEVKWKDTSQTSDLNYPLSTMNCTKKSDFNVLMIVLDSTRYDQLNADVMPHAHQLKEKSLNFQQHFSGSNSTRGGIFSLFYGLPPLYFEKFREAKRGPVLFDELIRQNYDFGIFSSAPLTMPEFNQTVFQQIPNLRVKSKAQGAVDRDAEITQLAVDFLRHRDSKKPFFTFLFYDSPHEFAIDKNHIKFEPYWKNINYFALSNQTDPTEFLNLHKNSVYYVDSLLGQLQAELRAQKLFDNTIIIFTADHGQEFNDNKMNFWGHNSNFTDAQTQVPFFIHWPGRPSGSVSHWTSSYDVPATLLEELLGCQNPSADYSSGQNLYKHNGHPWLVQGTYGDFAIRMPDHFIVISLSGNYQILDRNYREKSDIKVDPEIYQKALLEMRRFYK